MVGHVLTESTVSYVYATILDILETNVKNLLMNAPLILAKTVEHV